ncbi:hypothetical protein EJB05_03031 [Eragrostis curvula]|uniref:SGNH hydrolase-type esterase domain-containing protein n=1 Tax=Eragrostis curvula TaxID=38414 RepID=A0A5J9WU45_9POAL|nr:hypothetical protein EJB05_03031 [Eragrostis curvula]
MKINFVLLSCLCFLILLSGAHVEARNHRGSDRRRNYKLFLFGDSFVDIGNREATQNRVAISGQWYIPYGMSDSAHGYRPTGRFSDGLVQSDFLAKILGRDESPPAYRLWVNADDDGSQFSGVNFAVAGSSVFFNGSEVAASLETQINQFRDLVRAGDIEREDLQDSIALVAVSVMHDYARISSWNSDDEFRTFTTAVTDQIVTGVRRLQRLGVSKVLVDLVPPFGCTPWRSRSNYYTTCDSRGNVASSMHNAALKQKLGGSDDVLLLNLEDIFNSVLQSGTDLSRQFNRKFTPCCDSPDAENGYCGMVDSRGNKQYNVCPSPGNFFYWDFWHPTQAGWRAVMQVLEDPIKDFLGI